MLSDESTAYPHKVPHGQALNAGEMVLIDAVTTVEVYHSEITCSYVFSEPAPRQREIKNLELAALAPAFDAAQLGAPCKDVDAAARAVFKKGRARLRGPRLTAQNQTRYRI